MVLKIKTYLNLGILNLFRIIIYRLKLKTGWLQRATPVLEQSDASTDGSLFFKISSQPLKKIVLEPTEQQALLSLADDLLDGYSVLFSAQRVKVGIPPHWHQNPLSSQYMKNPERHWTKIPDFSQKFGDIKTLWELSRTEWAPLLAQAYCVNQDEKYLITLNNWLADWQSQNPVNQGANWKCGQETSFRVLHVLLASLILGQNKTSQPSPALKCFVRDHSQRISATLSYAIAQDNNHGTSEAAALFICGHWLLYFSTSDDKNLKTYQKWAKTGRNNLENRIGYLVMEDGTFSQYSPTYQRVVLATLNQIFIWQDRLDIAAFSDQFMRKTKQALEWLYQLTDPQHGDVPNLGANDGANVFRLSWHESYRDFRPVISVLAACLGQKCPYGLVDTAALWFGQNSQKPQQESLPPLASQSMKQGGFEKLVAPDQKSWALLRTANFKFRPSHADLNHFDLWFEGQNIAMDSGSYSYAAPPKDYPHALKTAFAHNTITFDGKDQMPSLGRFLYGAWPKAVLSYGKTDDDAHWTQSDITLFHGNRHIRKVVAGQDWTVEDTIEGTFKQAILRWHLPDLDWQLDKTGRCTFENISIEITQENLKGQEMHNAQNPQNSVQASLKQGLVSYYYLETQPCKVLEVILEAPQNISSEEKRFLSIATLFKFKI